MKRQTRELIKLLIGTILMVTMCIFGVWTVQLGFQRYAPDFGNSHAIWGTVIILLFLIYIFWIGVRLYHSAINYDALTTVPNGDWILQKGGAMYYRSRLIGYTSIFMNLRDFKYINQKIGNRKGDEVLRKYAVDMYQYVKGKGYMGRMGGDNFLIYLKNEDADDFLEFCKTIVVDTEVDGENESLALQFRAGVYKVVSGVGYRDIINRSSAALALAKETNKSIVYFEDSMIQKIVEDKEISNACKQALKNSEFLPFYQPKVDAKTGRLCGAEALARWRKDGSLVPPIKFVPVMEKEGTVTKLDFYIFEQVCSDIRDWVNRGMEPVRVSVNFSKLHLKNPDFAKQILEIRDQYGVDSKFLEVELTESSCSEDYKILREFAKVMKENGIHLSIDDFGTGYSSLSMLRGWHADVIKLDKSFLDSASDEDPSSKLFIQDIIHMIENQDELILCEGVETVEQLKFLQEAGCDIIQGYYFDKPLEKNVFEERLFSPQYEKAVV